MSVTTSIWRGRQFLPLWLSQFLSALNDNMFRFGMNAAITFGAIALSKDDSALIVSLSPALFVLPYLFVSGVSGQLADKYSKSMLLRSVRGLEIFVFGLGGYALIIGHVPLLLICVVLIGAMAAFYGPIKHAITPELLPTNLLIDANGSIEAGTYAAILAGMLAGTALITVKHTGPAITVECIMAIAIASWIFSLLTPSTAPGAPKLKIDWNVPKQTWDLIVWGAEDKLRTTLLLGNGWFWFVGTAVLSLLPIFVRDDLHANKQLYPVLLSFFACGIALGAWTCSALLRGKITLQFSSVAALGMAVWATVCALLVYTHPALNDVHRPLIYFFDHKWTGLLFVSIILLAANAGLFVVPMVTMMQTCVEPGHRARLLSLSNIWFAIFIAAGSFLSTGILWMHGSPNTVFAVIGGLCLIVSIIFYRTMPRETVKSLFAALLRILYRVEVRGIEAFDSAGPSAVIVANHQSLIDGVLLGAFLPGNPIFAIDPIAASRWWAKPLVALVDITTLNPLQPMSVRHLIQTVQSGRHCVIFPEGRLTQTGGLMKVYPGPAVIAGKSNAPIIAVRIDGVQHTPFSYLRGIVPTRWFPKVVITILPAASAPDTSDLSGRERRQAMTRNLYDTMTGMIMATEPAEQTIWSALTAAKKEYGGKTDAFEDGSRNPINYEKLLISSLALGAIFDDFTKPKEHVGVLLPTGIAGVVTFFALQSSGRVPAMLNFTGGPSAVAAMLNSAQITKVITAHEFVEKGKLEKLIRTITEHADLVYLEELRPKITLSKKLSALLKVKTGYTPKQLRKVTRDDAAVILFTSGSEGLPKGVVLSHGNLLANVQQIRTVIAYNTKDVFFNALPIFHAFGLTGGVLVPVLHGVKTFLHPSPLQYRVIPELVYHGNATIMFGTDTFLNGYAKAANDYDLYTVRLIVSGAEKLRPATAKIYAEKFGVPIFEGYGVTECSPAIALNTPMHHMPGTVGRLLPSIKHYLEKIDGIAEGGRLWVKGPNVMLGYYKNDQPGILQPLDDGWYDTGDIVKIDNAGFVSIQGRAKRFAKLGGEMVSLTAIETYAAACWPDGQHAAITLPDARKGEAVIVLTTQANATLSALSKIMRQQGASDISIPREVRVLESIPQLGSGKTDYFALQSLITV
jgi:acyl-[acyl-carrier-protein]-phospholipid O-acyltransferase/long-chain-fatty-acid--[acyl-carrier-protein] ligase